MSYIRGTSVVLFVLLSVTSARAQVIERPERPLRGVFGSDPPIDPNRTRQDLILNFSALGGYDDNPSVQEGVSVDAFAPRESGYTGFADATLSYRRVHQTQSFEVKGRGYGNTYRNLGITPTYGGDLQTRLSAPLGRSNQLEFVAAGRSAPYYAIATFAPLGVDIATDRLPDASPLYGFSLRRSIAGEASVSLTTRWSNKNMLAQTYRYNAQRFRDHLGDSHMHEGSLDYTRAFGRRSGLKATFRHSDQTYQEPLIATLVGSATRPLQLDSVELGYQHEHRLRRGKQWSFALGGGTTYVQTIKRGADGRLDYMTPSGYGSLRFDFARTWSIWGDYRRGVTVLEGLSAQSFITDTSMIRVGGYIGSRLELAVNADYSNGAAPVTSESHSTFDSYAATVQLRLLLTRWWSVVASDNVYQYKLHRFQSLPQGLRSELGRNAIRVGMNFDLPLYGSYAASRPARGN